jgi:hypothetical protein
LRAAPVAQHDHGQGHRVVATFRRAIPAAAGLAPSPTVRRAHLLCERARSLRTASAALHQESVDAVAEAERTLSGAGRRPRRSRGR